MTPMPLRPITGEPLFHSGITDRLPEDHPGLGDTLACSACGYTVANTEEGEKSMEAHIWTNHIRVLAS